MLTVDRIFALLDDFDLALGNDTARGASTRAAHLVTSERNNPAGSSAAQIEMLAWIARMDIRHLGAEPWHPSMVTPPAVPRPRGRLSSDEREWLASLSSNPYLIDRGQTCRLQALAQAMESDPLAGGDRDLVATAWAAVKSYHDLRHAKDALAEAELADLAHWPPTLAPAIADALIIDGTTDDADQAMTLAQDRLRDYWQARAERRSDRIARARKRLDELSVNA